MQFRRTIAALLAAALLALMGYSGARLWVLCEEARAERRLHLELLKQKPQPAQGAPADPLAELREKHPDIVGWITVPGTEIDYPVAQARDNDYYLRRDLNGVYAKPGTIFMDYRCAKDGGSYALLYGHHMKSGAMFGTLKRFEEKAFFDAHTGAALLLEDGWHEVALFAFLTVRADDEEIYGLPETARLTAYLDRNAQYLREINLSGGDRVLALSTCSYVFQDARMVLLGKIL